MLKKLTIQNFALIDVLSIEFNAGLNILTGETGAGKSIIIGAIDLILGARARNDVIRQGADKAVVEALFSVPDTLITFFTRETEDLFEDGVLIRREVHASGRNRCFINDSPVSLGFLAEVGDRLVDLHGQHDHQALLKKENHITCLDAFGIEPDMLTGVSEAYQAYQSVFKALQTLRSKEKNLIERQDLLSFQVQEIDQIAPQPDEEEALIHEERLLKSSEQLFQASALVTELLDEGEHAVIEKLSRIHTVLSRFEEMDPNIKIWLESCQSARIQLQDLVTGFQSFVAALDFNPERLEYIRERLGQFSHLKKKYGPTMTAVLEFRENSKKELAAIDHFDEEIHTLESRVKEKKDTFIARAKTLSNKRKSAAKSLESKMVEVLAELGLPRAVFSVQFDIKESDSGIDIDHRPVAVSPTGFDQVEFLISLNPGEAPRPLVKIASGGEISRLMLALKTVLSDADAIPVLVFDEIDTGISGRIARVVGRNLHALSGKHQLICITHLPQIASLGDSHYAVEKIAQDSRAITQIRRLDHDEREYEIAKLLGGETISETVLQSARELLNGE